jgi:tetratricopeptide (TPR) repeat protein
MKPIAVLCGLWLALLPLRGAYAQDAAPPNEQEAQRLYQIGQLQFEGKEFAQAAETFARAFALDPDATLAFNAARAFENSGNLDQAILHYRAALGADPPPDIKKQCESALTRLASIQENRSVEPGALAIDAQPSAEVTLNGEPRGKTPLELSLPPGDYELKLSLRGHQTQARYLRVSPGATSTVSAQLRPSELTWVAWTGLGLVGAGLGVGGGAFYFQGEAQARYDEAQTSLEAKRDPARFDALEQEAGDLQDTANLMLLTGGATVGLGLGLFALDWFGLFEGDEQVSSPGGASLWLGPGALGVQGSFD